MTMILNKIKSWFANLVKKIKVIIQNILSMFSRKNRSEEELVEFVHPNIIYKQFDDVEETHWPYQTDTITQSEMEMIKEHGRSILTSDKYYLENNLIRIFAPIVSTDYSKYSILKVEMDPNLQLVSDEESKALLYRVKFMNKTIMLTVPHVLLMMPEQEQSKYKSINPQLYVNSDRVLGFIDSPHFKTTQKVVISTMSTSEDYYVIQTVTSKMINVPIVTKTNKTKIVTVAAIVTIVEDIPMYWSGSIVNIGSYPFVISMKHLSVNTNIVKLVCVALCTHDYTFQYEV